MVLVNSKQEDQFILLDRKKTFASIKTKLSVKSDQEEIDSLLLPDFVVF